MVVCLWQSRAGVDLFVVYIVFSSFLLSQQIEYLSPVVLNKHCLVVHLLHLPLPLNAFGDPHIWPMTNKDVSQWPFLLSESSTSTQRLLWTLMHRWLVWWHFFFSLTRCQYVVLLLKGFGLKLESCSGLSLDLLSADLMPDILMAGFMSPKWTLSVRVPGQILRLQKVYRGVVVFWTNLTNCRAALHRRLFSGKVSCLSPGYRGQKGERGQLGLGLPGDPGQMGPPGKKK